MAMTKREQEELARLQREVCLNRALRWSASEPSPDLPVPDSTGFHTGWQFNLYTGVAFPAWSESSAHGTGHTRQHASQRGIELFSTKRLALQALRSAVERRAAEQLAGIDALISQEPI